MMTCKALGLVILAALTLTATAQSPSGDPVLRGFPASFHWRNQPVDWNVKDGVLTIKPAGRTDWFLEPTGDMEMTGAPLMLFPAPKEFWFSAKVTVDFKSLFDEGSLIVFADEKNWFKLSIKSQNEKIGLIDSAVTRGLSDDNTGAVIEGNSVYLKVSKTASKTGHAFFLFYSTDGKNWKVTRAFNLSTDQPLQFGFGSQSPTGNGTTAIFSEIHYQAEALKPWSSE